LCPRSKRRSILTEQRMENQGRKGKVIHHGRFIMAIPKIGKVVTMWNIRFGDKKAGRRKISKDPCKKPYDGMGFRMVQAIGSKFLPQKSHSIKANNGCPSLYIDEQHLHHMIQNIRVMVIHINLVFAEGSPNGFPFDGCKQ